MKCVCVCVCVLCVCCMCVYVCVGTVTCLISISSCDSCFNFSISSSAFCFILPSSCMCSCFWRSSSCSAGPQMGLKNRAVNTLTAQTHRRGAGKGSLSLERSFSLLRLNSRKFCSCSDDSFSSLRRVRVSMAVSWVFCKALEAV